MRNHVPRLCNIMVYRARFNMRHRGAVKLFVRRISTSPSNGLFKYCIMCPRVDNTHRWSNTVLYLPTSIQTAIVNRTLATGLLLLTYELFAAD